MTNEEIVLLYQHSDNKKYYSELLYNQNKKMIYKIAKRYIGYAEIDDLMQEGFIALLDGADKWKEDEGVLFTTYVYKAITSHLRLYIDTNCNVVRIPSHQKARILKMKKVIDSYIKESGSSPGIKELSKLLNLSREDTEQLLSDALFLDVQSTNEVLKDNDNLATLEDTIPDSFNQYEALEDSMENERLKNVLWGIVDKLPPAERQIIHERYENNLSSNSICDVMGITEQSLKNAEARAFRELRKHSNKAKLKPFFNESKLYSISIKYAGYGYFKNTWTSSPEMAVLMCEKRL